MAVMLGTVSITPHGTGFLLSMGTLACVLSVFLALSLLFTQLVKWKGLPLANDLTKYALTAESAGFSLNSDTTVAAYELPDFFVLIAHVKGEWHVGRFYKATREHSSEAEHEAKSFAEAVEYIKRNYFKNMEMLNS